MRINPVKIFNNSVVLKNNATIHHQSLSFGADSFEKKENNKFSLAQKRKTLKEYKNIGLKDYFKALALDDIQFFKFVEFLENEEKKANLAFQYSKLDSRQFGLYNYLRDRSVSAQYALKATDYSNDELDRFSEIFQQGAPGYMMDEAVKFEEKKFARVKELLEEKVSFVAAYETVKLEDEQYEKAMQLKNKGFKLLFASEVVKDNEIYELLNKAIDEKIDMKILDVAFKYSTKFPKIKDSKTQNPKEFFAKMALLNASEGVVKYFDEQIKNATANPKTTFDKTGKVLEHTISEKKTEIKCNYKYDKHGELRQVIYSNSENYPLALRFSLNNKTLTQVTYLKNNDKIDLDIKSPEFVNLFDTQYGTERLVKVMLLVNSAQNLTDEEFEDLNNLVFKKESKELSEAKKDFNKEFPDTKLLVDNSMEIKYITRLKDVLKTQAKQDLPKKIFLTAFMPHNTSGEFMHKDKIAVAPNMDIDFFDITIYHELQHRKDYATGAPYGQKRAGLALVFDREILSDCDDRILKGKIMFLDGDLVISNSDLKNLITQQVSSYATTDCAEFIAEFGAMIRKGIIGVKVENNEIKYSINQYHKDTRQKDCIINKEEFAKLIKLYLLLGGTPEFNNNFREYDEKIITISQKEAMETEL